MRSITVTKRAKENIHKAAEYYDKIDPALSRGFYRAIREFYERIIHHPMSFPVERKDIRRAYIKRFSFALYYRIHPEKIRILAVLHTSQNTEKVKGRL